MATIKSYSDLQQSKKLAEILPFESADMWYQYTGISIKDGSEKPIYFPMVIRDDESDEDIPCWSLAALLGALPTFTINSSDDHYFRIHCQQKFSEWHDNLIDACYEMILKLNELNLL